MQTTYPQAELGACGHMHVCAEWLVVSSFSTDFPLPAHRAQLRDGRMNRHF